MIQLYCMGGIYFVLGIVHFTHTGFYRPMMPKFLPAHDALIYWSGIAEIVLGLVVLFSRDKKHCTMGYYCYANRIFSSARQYAAAGKQAGDVPLGAWTSNSNTICPHVLGLCEPSLKAICFLYSFKFVLNQPIPNSVSFGIQMQTIGYKQRIIGFIVFS